MAAQRAESEEILTLQEFEALPEEDAYRLELVRGRLVREPRPGVQHGLLMARLGARLQRHVEENRLGVVSMDFGVVLPTEPPTVRGPDIGFIAADRLPPDGPPTGFLRVAPDLAVEIVSPSNSASEIQEKVLEYLDAGTRLVWLVDPKTRTTVVYRSRSEIALLSEEDELEGGDVLPSFRLPVSEIFGE